MIGLVNVAYLIAAVLFILSLSCCESPASERINKTAAIR